ncbi:phosphotransferase [Lactobacillus agrestimuris]|uniref:phosphotransferase n=1 Tax=Lactobacillus agrestimuris TaxID=2941328 RepID=UPI002044B48A|nr:phosphotransferase [Lactobacillus agrestimuris]
MDINEFKLLNYFYNKSHNRSSILLDKQTQRVLNNKKLVQNCITKGLIRNNKITDEGINKLQPYKVTNAVIMAAGAATRLIPISLEYPKGLFEVRGQRLIEREIKQLKEAEITNITVVLGYKKEMFYYLKDKYDVKLIINDQYNIKNNIESLYLAKNELSNTYICPCDQYFINNPFNKFEYNSFYAGYESDSQADEMYAITDNEDKIIDMKKSMSSGDILLGHTFWTNEFSQKFIKIAESDQKVGKYNNQFWEWLVKDNLNNFPNYYFKEYPVNTIFEFDYFDQLRDFDQKFVGHANSQILRNIKLIFRCEEEDIVDFRPIKEGMTNTSFVFRVHGEDYVYRHPGTGTEKVVNRKNEKESLLIAKKFDVDPTYIYMDSTEGWKISRYIPEFREPKYNDFEDSKKIIPVLRRLHSADVKVDYGMKPWEDAETMEKLIEDKDSKVFSKNKTLKEKVYKLYKRTLLDSVKKCFCHGDTYCHNWMVEPNDHVLLIDWEYAGYSDPGIDVGYYIVDAMYDFEDAIRFIKEYLGDEYSEEKEFHYLAYVAIIAYYWFVWAVYRESCGANMGESLYNWKKMAEKYSTYVINRYHL